jgi:DNA-binding LacI/PurR family transcriptional regulator
MNLGLLRAGDTFIGVTRGDPGRRNDPDKAADYVVLRIGRKYLYAKRVDGHFGEVAFGIEHGLEKAGYKPMRAYPSRAQWEAEQRREAQLERIRRLARDMGYGVNRLAQNELDQLETILLRATQVPPP